MAKKPSRNKRKALGIRINPKEGPWIKYQLGPRDMTLSDFAYKNGVGDSAVSMVLRGNRKSARLEAAIVQTLGYPSFKAMIAAARGKGGAA